MTYVKKSTGMNDVAFSIKFLTVARYHLSLTAEYCRRVLQCALLFCMLDVVSLFDREILFDLKDAPSPVLRTAQQHENGNK